MSSDPSPVVERRSSDLRYRSLFANMLNGLAHCQMVFQDGVPVDCEFIDVNPAFERDSGLSDVVGHRISEFIPDYARDNPVAMEAFARVARTGEPERLEHHLGVVDKWFSLAIYSPATGEFIVLGEDVTERKRAEDALHASEDRFRQAKTAAGLGIYDHDIAGGAIEWDERARELWGVGPDEPITYETFLAGLHPDDRAATQAAIGRALDPQGTGEYHAEYRVIRRSDGSMRDVAANGQAIFEGGHAVRMVGTLKDVSAEKRLEREMQERRSEMEQLARQQVAAHTAAAIAHELNQPLVSISAYSEAALRMLRGGSKSPEKLTRAIEGAMEQAQRAGRTLHDLLDFLHKGEPVSEPVDLNTVVREALAIVEEGGYGGFHPAVELEPDLPLVQANRLHLEKVLINLLHNGVEAMREAGVPTAAIAIRVRTMAGTGMAKVTVQDSGPGVDAETVHRIFEPFFTTKSAGVGLGLAISRALIEAHGGQLWADPEMDQGATFHFTLPFAP